MTSEIEDWLDQVERAIGQAPLIYGSLSVFEGYFGGEDAFENHEISLAEYSESPQHNPEGWPAWTYWQYTDSLSVSGVEGNVDGDRFSGSREDFQALLAKGPTQGTGD